MAKAARTADPGNVDTPQSGRLEDRDEVARRFMASAIKVRREKCEMSVQTAAAALGISDRTLRRWEVGHGELWTGGAGNTADHTLMAKLRTIYELEWDRIRGERERLDPEMASTRNQYPGAPLDPAARRIWFWRRNAKIQGIDPDEFVELMLASRQPSGSNQRGEG